MDAFAMTACDAHLLTKAHGGGADMRQHHGEFDGMSDDDLLASINRITGGEDCALANGNYVVSSELKHHSTPRVKRMLNELRNRGWMVEYGDKTHVVRPPLHRCCDSHLAKRAPRKTRVGEYVAKHQAKLAKRVARVLALAAATLAKKVRKMTKLNVGSLAKRDLTDEQQALIDDILAQLDADEVSVSIIDKLTPELVEAFKEAGLYGLAQVGFDTSAGGKDITGQLDEAALAYAQERSTELIKDLAGTTREDLQAVIANGVADGLSTSELADMIEETGAFGEVRAEMIARTELADAHVQGNIEGWRQSGEVSQKEWLTAEDCCDECDEMNGEIVGIDENFSSGDPGPTLHPRCRCDVLPVLSGQEDSQGEE